jgi:hypothetical protein
LLQRKAEPLLFVLVFLILADLVILGAGTLGVKGVVALAAVGIALWIATRAEWALAFMMMGYPLLNPVAKTLDSGGIIPLGLRALALAALAVALATRAGGGVGSALRRCVRHPLLWITMAFAALLYIGALHAHLLRLDLGA